MSKKKTNEPPVTITKLERNQYNKVLITYDNENEFKKILGSLKKYTVQAYKQFIFKVLPNLREGNLLGESLDKVHYEIDLVSDISFKFVHGKIKLHYRIDNGLIVLEDIEPKKIFRNGYLKELTSYKGVIVATEQDKFKVDLYYATKVHQKLP